MAKSRNSAGVNFCTRRPKTAAITWHLHVPVRWCGWTGTVIQGGMTRVAVNDGDNLDIVGMKAIKEISKAGNIRLSNIDTTILWHVKRCNIRSYSFALDNFSFACDNFSFALDNFHLHGIFFHLYWIIFICMRQFSFALDNFHLHAIIFICMR